MGNLENDSIIKIMYFSILIYILMKNTTNYIPRNINNQNIGESLFSFKKYIKFFDDLKKKIIIIGLVLFLILIIFFLLYRLYLFWKDFNKDFFCFNLINSNYKKNLENDKNINEENEKKNEKNVNDDNDENDENEKNINDENEKKNNNEINLNKMTIEIEEINKEINEKNII